MIKKIFHQLIFESPSHQTEWNGLSLTDIAKEAGIPLNQVAASDFYSTFYKRLEATGFIFDPEWLKQKKLLSKFMRTFIDDFLANQSNATFLSLGVGTGVVEEDILNDGIEIDLQECQSSSLNYLRSKNIQFKSYIGTDLSIIPDSSYDIVFAFTISYCFSYNDYIDLMKHIHRILTPNGQLIIFDSSSMRFKNSYLMHYIKCTIRLPINIVKRYIGRHIHKPIFWGWFRHPYLHKTLAKKAGFIIENSFFMNSTYTEKVHYSNGTSAWFILNK